ncbi:Phage coat protein Gp5 (plasmid) [Gemmatirosa kalamazoonensis]|uniref:Phage coat protein Gp5 n=1 Tax=Gemmatirosa kalamazoonensis TaxID=861299 RepID=W0RPF1_9BACT|nr:hypothetical protein [Gemmatirosa kalamazoonensis]AHG92200.1 Phage coat protein Gp5 [Gemmatirosa kalamazoonensis]
MPITTLLPQVTAQFLTQLRARAIATRVVSRDLDPAPANLGDTISVRVAKPQAPQAVVPGYQPTAPQAADTDSFGLKVDKFYERSMALTDKEVGEIESGNTPAQVTQMGIDLAEQVNGDVYAAAVVGAGRLIGTPGTNPFATDEQPFLDALQHLDEQRAAVAGRVGVLTPAAYWRAFKVPNFAQADRRGDAANPLVTGDLNGAYGTALGTDQLIPNTVTNAIGAGALTVNGAAAAGALSFSIAKGAGANWNAKAGDVISIAGHSRNYVLAADVVVAQAGNTTVTINAALTRTATGVGLGLEKALAGGEAITVLGAGTTYSNSLVIHQSGVVFASRPLKELTIAGFNPANVFTYTDPQTGLVFRAEIERQNYQSKLKIATLYGVGVFRSALVARLAGA